MKKVLLVLALATTMFSCTPDDQCGTVTNYDIINGNYVVYLDGSRHNVNFSTWWEASIGNYMCIEY